MDGRRCRSVDCGLGAWGSNLDALAQAEAVVRLQRHETGDQGTFGRLLLPNGLWFYSGELGWHDNLSDISCVPPAPGGDPITYRVVWTFSPRFRRLMYLLLGTEPRGGIREHSANFMGDDRLGYHRQLNGCIALGEKLGWMENQKALLLSAPAVRRFETEMAGAPFQLEVSWN